MLIGGLLPQVSSNQCESLQQSPRRVDSSSFLPHVRIQGEQEAGSVKATPSRL